MSVCIFFFNDTATTEIYTLSLHDALPICWRRWRSQASGSRRKSRASWAGSAWVSQVVQPSWVLLPSRAAGTSRSEEHTSELQSQSNLVCRLLLEKKKNNSHTHVDDIITQV